MAAQDDITELLNRFRQGDSEAKAALIAAVYDELKVMASRYMRRERGDHTLQTTALVNEAYLRLIHLKSDNWRDRVHFFAVAAQVMRSILVDHARKHLAGKRGGGVDMLPLDEGLVFHPERSEPLLKLDEALTRLMQHDGRASRIIELRFFGGLSVDETAEVLNISPRTVKREWTFGRAWLRTELGLDGSDGSKPVE